MIITRTLSLLVLLAFCELLTAACPIDDFDDLNDDGWIRCGNWGGRKTPVWDASDGRYCLSMSEPVTEPPPPPLTIAAEWTKAGETPLYANGCVSAGFQAGTVAAGTWTTNFVLGLRADCKNGGYKALLGPAIGRISIFRRLELLGDNLEIHFEQDRHYRAEFCAIGSKLSLTVWDRDKQKPSEPQLKAENGQYTYGNIGIGVFIQNDNRGPNVSGCFDDIHFEPAPDCTSDLNCDRVVDAQDIKQVAAAFGREAPCGSGLIEDLDSSCDVGLFDAFAAVKSWGSCPTSRTGL